MYKKAQAAMEFLMTYGWAILVVLVAIGALAYFGVLSPDKFLPERCTGPSGMACLDKASISDTTGTVKFAIRNNLGFGIFLTGIAEAISNDCATITKTEVQYNNGSTQELSTTAVDGNGLVKNGDNVIINVTCDDGVDSGRFSSDISIPYLNKETGLDHNAKYSMTGSAS